MKISKVNHTKAAIGTKIKRTKLGEYFIKFRLKKLILT